MDNVTLISVTTVFSRTQRRYFLFMGNTPQLRQQHMQVRHFNAVYHACCMTQNVPHQLMKNKTNEMPKQNKTNKRRTPHKVQFTVRKCTILIVNTTVGKIDKVHKIHCRDTRKTRFCLLMSFASYKSFETNNYSMGSKHGSLHHWPASLFVGQTCLTPSCLRRGSGGDRDPIRWGKRETIG